MDTFGRAPYAFHMRSAWVLLLTGLAGSAALGGCQGATQAKLQLYTDVPASTDVQVGLWTQRGAGADVPQAAFEPSWGADGVLGSIVTVPDTTGDESPLYLRVVLANKRPATSCAAGGPGCIIATRRVSFLRHQRLTVPIGLFQACDGVRCDEGTTCNSLGRCVSDALDATSCSSSDGCILEGDPRSAPGVRRPAPIEEEVRADAGADATVIAPVAAIPTPLAAYLDEDPRRGFTRGTVELAMPTHEPPIDGYLLSLTDGLGKRQLLTTAPAGSPLRVKLDETPVPAGMEWLEIVAARGKERSAPRVIEGDNYLRLVDVGANAGVDSLSAANIHADIAKNKLVVVATDALRRPTARVCELDGSSCSLWKVDAGLGPDSAASYAFLGGVSAAGTTSILDATSRQLFIATSSLAQGKSGLRLIQCGLDSRVCTERQVTTTPGRVTFFVDTTAQRVLVFETGDPNPSGFIFGGGPPPVPRLGSVSSCPFAGAPCTRFELPTSFTGATVLSNLAPTLVPGTIAGVFATPGAVTGTTELTTLSCSLDALGACTATKIPNGGLESSPSALAVAAKHLHVVARVGNSADYRLYDCDESLQCSKRTFSYPGGGWLDGVTLVPPTTAGTFRFLARGFASGNPNSASVKVYECPVASGAPCSSAAVPGMGSQPRFHGEQGGRLLVGVTTTISDAYNQNVPSYSLHSCAPAMAPCSSSSIGSDENRGNSAYQTDVAVDSARDRSVVISTNPSDRLRSAVFVCNARGESCVYRAPSGDEPAGSQKPRTLLPAGGQRLVTSVLSSGKVLLSSCSGDGLACTTTTLAVSGAYFDESALEYEPGNGRVVLFAFAADKVHHFRCNADGNACVHTPLGTLPLTQYGASYRVTVTATRLWVLGGKNALECAVDGTSCAQTALDASVGTWDSQALLDTKRMKLIVIPAAGTSAWECETSGASCVAVPMVGQLPSTSFAQWSQAVVDAERGAAYFAQAQYGSFEVHRCAREPAQWTCAALGRGVVPYVNVLTPPRDSFGLRLDTAGQRLVAAAVDERSRRPTLYTMRLF